MAQDQNSRSKVSFKFGSRSKVLKSKHTIIRAFDLLPKSVRTTLAVVLKTKNTIIRTFDLLPKSVGTTLAADQKF